MLKEEKSNIPICTMSKNIDDILSGGIHPSKITEIAGIAGVGKTQLWYLYCIILNNLHASF